MSFLRDPKAIEEAIQPSLAKKLLLNLRVYVVSVFPFHMKYSCNICTANIYAPLHQANFYAQFIYLHRVAFKTYPATADVAFAIARIVGLAENILYGGERDQTDGKTLPISSRASQHSISLASISAARTIETMGTSQGHEADSETGLPATMLWPLFLAAIEGTVSDRQSLLQMMREMDTQRVTNAARTIFLLEEVLRRQDHEGRRVDHRSVRQDLFEGELSVLY